MNVKCLQLYDGTLTSSFPSRAVTCCVVYLYLLSGILEILSRPEKDPVAPFRLLWSPAFILFTIWAVVWTSIARVSYESIGAPHLVAV